MCFRSQGVWPAAGSGLTAIVRTPCASYLTWWCHFWRVQDPEDDWGSQYTARNRLVRDLTALGIGFDHYGGCKFGTEEAAAKLPSSQVRAAAQRSHGIPCCWDMITVVGSG